MPTLIQNVRLIDAQTDQISSLVFDENGIHTVGKVEDFDGQTVDGAGKILMPGLIDPHVHFREPGFEHKETIATGSRAAISAGVTGFFEMPNTEPPTFTRELLAAKKQRAAETSLANYAFYFGSGPDNQTEIEAVTGVPGIKLYLNTTTGNLKMDQEDRWAEIFRLGKRVALHAEGETFQRAVNLWLAEGAPCALHLCHASLRSEVELVRKLKAEKSLNQPISMEVCPHHLFMTHEDRLKHGAYCCMKPELATKDDCEALWEGVLDGTVDCFATDHAPHTREEKDSGQIYYGIPGVETLWRLLFTEFVARGYDLKRLAAMTSWNIYQNFEVPGKRGLIKSGFVADLVLISPKITGVIDAKDFYSKCDWTPFAGRKTVGKIDQVWLNGKTAYTSETREFDGEIGTDLFV